ncbi:MAG: hypothetical protein J7J31_03785 [Helicobacteraceae bacterium]|nr:hypothetical protein [Helicobacteraceae bacterium]
MSKIYSPPLAINFIWHPTDSEEVKPILDVIKKSFARNKDKPFSRALNIPLFFYSSINSKIPPHDYPYEHAKNNLVFIFTSVNTVGKAEWKNYVEGFPQSSSIDIIPIAIDSYGYSHGGTLAGLNSIRASDWSLDNRELHAMVAIAHEVYRFSCKALSPEERGDQSSMSIFLSHAKSGETGKWHAEEIKKFIDNTNMNRFFDANEISPGYYFDQEIEKHMQDSTLIAIENDTYSSRYWCQREILTAKKYNCPIIVVNCLDDFEDRIFPATSNVPSVHVSASVPINERDILRVLSSAIIESIRFYYSIQCLEAYSQAGWIEEDCALSARPPEIRQVLNFKKNGTQKICYPEPPIYSIEADWHEDLEIEAFTPLWRSSEKDILSEERVGISISDVAYETFSEHHINADSLIRLAQDLGRHLLSRSATLIYGGDMRPGGFTEFILDEASILKDRLEETVPHVENHLAWPLYISDKEITAWRAKYTQVMTTIEHGIPSDVDEGLDKDTFLAPISPLNSYIWSRCLTEMRKQSISSSTARICAGGKQSGYKGKMPGVLEEIVLAIEANKPIFLLGAFGGVVGDVCSLIMYGEVPELLTEKWQVLHNEGYSDLQKLACSHGHGCNYTEIIGTIQNLTVYDLASRCGLNESEYARLMISPFIDECIYLILKGLKELHV